MDSKNIIRKYINPNIWVLLVGVVGFILGMAMIGVLPDVAFVIMMITVIPFFAGLFGILPAMLRQNKFLNTLEQQGQLDRAAQELNGANAKVMCKNKVTLTDNFLFVRKGGYVCACSDILWMHKHKYTSRVLFIPVYTRESLVVYTGKGSYYISLNGKDKNNELGALIQELYRRNNKILVGYTAENQKAYKQLRKG